MNHKTRGALPLFSLPCNQVNRSSFKDKGLADLIFQETQVRKVHELFFIDKNDKGWRFGCYLSRIENLETFAFTQSAVLWDDCFTKV